MITTALPFPFSTAGTNGEKVLQMFAALIIFAAVLGPDPVRRQPDQP